jgi:hypothetical protein
MNYYVKRGDQQYGPYSLALLQQYVSQGNISLQDLARSEAMSDWVPVATVLGNVPASTAPAASGFGATTASGLPPVDRALPPNLHWGVVLALSLVTIGIFWIIWGFVEAFWIRKVWPKSKAVYYLAGYLACVVLMASVGRAEGVSVLLQLGGTVLWLVGVFTMRSDIEEFYSTLNPVGLNLSAGMTFFFNVVYFQYHFQELREEMQRNTAAAAAAH